MKYIIYILILTALPSFLYAQIPSAEEILRKIDENMVVNQAVSVNTMIIHGRINTRTIKSIAWLDGQDKALIEYTYPPREQGTKMLKLKDVLYTYIPEPDDRIITIAGHLLRQSVMGSDLSYEDMVENKKYSEMYNAEVIGQENYNDRMCWVLLLTAIDKEVAYPSRKLWVDAERWLPLKENRYAKSGKLLKTTEITDVFQVDSRWFPKRIVFKDMLVKGEGTEYIFDSIDLNVQIPLQIFTKASLRK